VVLGPGCASWLLEHFKDVDTSASMAQRATQVRMAQGRGNMCKRRTQTAALLVMWAQPQPQL
jgi:hypothetical protein